jgi:hypothetical protein
LSKKSSFCRVVIAGITFQAGSAAIDSATIIAALIYQLTGGAIIAVASVSMYLSTVAFTALGEPPAVKSLKAQSDSAGYLRFPCYWVCR